MNSNKGTSKAEQSVLSHAIETLQKTNNFVIETSSRDIMYMCSLLVGKNKQ